MSMSKKDFVAIAALINSEIQTSRHLDVKMFTDDERFHRVDAICCVADRLSMLLASNYPRFDKQKFYDACVKK